MTEILAPSERALVDAIARGAEVGRLPDGWVMVATFGEGVRQVSPEKWARLRAAGARLPAPDDLPPVPTERAYRAPAPPPPAAVVTAVAVLPGRAAKAAPPPHFRPPAGRRSIGARR